MMSFSTLLSSSCRRHQSSVIRRKQVCLDHLLRCIQRNGSSFNNHRTRVLFSSLSSDNGDDNVVVPAWHNISANQAQSGRNFSTQITQSAIPVRSRTAKTSTKARQDLSTLSQTDNRQEQDIFALILEEGFQEELSSIESVMENLDKASGYNFGKGGKPKDKRMWDVDVVRTTVAQYEYYLKMFHNTSNESTTPTTATSTGKDYSLEIRKLFLSSETTQKAFRALLRCKLDTSDLSQKVREWERYLGNLGETSMTNELSLAMIHANGKAGNVGRALSLLNLRKSRNYEPTQSEFIHAVNSIDAAGLELRRNRNTFLSEQNQPQIDDPTRWLDAILLNMSQRHFTLTTWLANKMLNTYSTTGKSGKAIHYFYNIHRTPITEEDYDENADRGIARYNGRPVKIRMKMRPPPPYHKIPSQVRGKFVRKPGTTTEDGIKQLKMDRESDPDWSPALTAAISFADSLKHGGACGHEPIELDLISYSILIKVCVNRGSLWRAMHILDEVMPSNYVEPDVVAFNTLLSGLARVGDVPTIREYFSKMVAMGISPSPETIQSYVEGLLNLGDISAAITVVQDCFNQHSVLPPYTIHLKILEFALARGLVYEAKRHVFFIQQLWKWERNDYHSEEFSKIVELTKRNPKLSKEALERLFAYFGESLEQSDFF